ncbi:hypothetical protein HRG_009283 [Hirsutella rhossiliensis]|uniref:Uncharacterized protein n=1 Tax=Hirsutella rhossiliensis TaxID=111463 RepID=A0A9P8MSN6_9HYPO|nr:uncharacterized protein HRG_09283 [Hirsutella rhossiliensis]KAH0959501.1 hypothetical protein HRG_09283 [Hirsutella rhossiliensis]
MATLSELQTAFNGKTLDLSRDEANKKWILHFNPTSDYTLATLGNGTGKLLFRVVHHGSATDWVFCIRVQRDDADAAKKELRTEMEILQRLGKAGVPVPGPFREGQPPHFVSCEVTNFDDEDPKPKKSWGFFLQFTDMQRGSGRFVEMKKVENPTTADRGQWLRMTMETENPGPELKERTKRSLGRIREAWKAEQWGDFQAAYDRETGELMVFDPYDVLSNADQTTSILEEWAKYLESC